jgi:phospholipid/cholesterol/gamma-HCH transport system substrate-binding protein
MNEQAMRFRVGVFLVVMVVLLGVLMLMFGGLPGWFTAQNHYTVILRDAAGIGSGTPVRRSGVRIGEVKKVRLDNDTGLVHLDITTERKYPLHENDEVHVTRGLLGGDVALDFVTPATDTKASPAEEAEEPQAGRGPPPAPPGTVFRAKDQENMERLLSQTAGLVPDARAALQDFRQAMRRLERLLPQVQATLQDVRALSKDTREAVPDLRHTAADIRDAVRPWGALGDRLSNVVQANQDRLTKALDNFSDVSARAGRALSDENLANLNESLKNFRGSTARFDGVVKNADELIKESRQTLKRVDGIAALATDVFANLQRASKPWGDASASIVKNLDTGSAELTALLGEVRQFLRTFTGSQGTLGMLLNDPGLYNNLNDVACMLVRLLPRVDRILRDAELFADKIARHPESLGLGGVMIPGSGLKR